MDERGPVGPEARAALAAAIEAAVRAIPGVSDVVLSRSPISLLLREGAGALGVREADWPVVPVVSVGDGVAVEVSIELGADADIDAMVRAVRSATGRVLGAAGVRGVSIEVRVEGGHGGDTEEAPPALPG